MQNIDTLKQRVPDHFENIYLFYTVIKNSWNARFI